jgi:RNA polymerase sigma-70 factor (ECF subfamily)
MLTFQDLYESHVVDVYRFSLWISGDQAEAEDITSETFIRAWGRRQTIRTETLKAYLFTISRNIYLERSRKLKKLDDLDPDYPDPVMGPEEIVNNHMDLVRIQLILQKIPEIDRTAFILRVQHELAYAEIARVLGISLSNAKVKVHRTRKQVLLSFLEKEANK